MIRRVFGGINMLSKRQQFMHTVNEYEEIFQCPICREAMQLSSLGQLQCEKRHAFDIAKQGYLNFLQKPIQSMYSKELFEARYKVISSGLYDEVQQEIASIMDEGTVLDTGCGEGSHLARILTYKQSSIGVGIDIAKEGIISAAKFNNGQIWAVADLAKSPFQQESFQSVLNFLSPANYSEFKRLLKPSGKLIKVIPGENYLHQLRTQAFAGSEKETYSNEQTIERFKEQFEKVSVKQLTYTKSLSSELAKNLIQMTPMGWHVDHKEQLKLDEITIDVHILCGEK